MSPIAHFIGSWLVAAATVDNPRDRRLVTLAGILPDLDGLGMVADFAKAWFTGQEATYHYYHKFHHLWAHGWPAALVITIALTCLARRHGRVLVGCLLTFHLHLLCDLLGSRGPAPADLWPICYSEPLFPHPIWFWKGQWRLDGWQNTLICIAIFGAALWLAIKRRYSFVEVFSPRMDSVFVAVLKNWQSQFCARSVRQRE